MDSISFFWSFFKMLASLAVVIAMMIGAMYLMRKYFYQSPTVIQGNALINIIYSRPLSPKSSIILIEVLGKLILVSLSGQQIAPLATIDDPTAFEKLKNYQLKQSLSPAPDQILHLKSLVSKIFRMRKNRQDNE